MEKLRSQVLSLGSDDLALRWRAQPVVPGYVMWLLGDARSLLKVSTPATTN